MPTSHSFNEGSENRPLAAHDVKFVDRESASHAVISAFIPLIFCSTSPSASSPRNSRTGGFGASIKASSACAALAGSPAGCRRSLPVGGPDRIHHRIIVGDATGRAIHGSSGPSVRNCPGASAVTLIPKPATSLPSRFQMPSRANLLPQ